MLHQPCNAIQKAKCFPSLETHQLEPWSMSSEYLTAKAGAAHNCYTRPLTTCLHFQDCLDGLIYALCIKPSAMEFEPDFLHVANCKGYPWVLRGMVHFHYIYLYKFFSFIIGSIGLNSTLFQALVSHICITWNLMKIYLILYYVNSFKVQH